MTVFPQPLFWLFFIYFAFIIFFAYYIPGNLVIEKLRLTRFSTIIASIVLGMVFWALQGVIFGYLSARWLSYVYLAAGFVIWLKETRGKKITLPAKKYFKQLDASLLLLIFLGSVIQILTVWFIGFSTREGLAFCCFWPDSFYHLSLTNELIGNFPPFEPGTAGVVVRNYHYLTNLIVAELIRVFRLPLIPTFYQYMPVFLSPLVGLTLLTVATELPIRKSFMRWLIFFFYFSGDIIFLILFLMGRGLVFDLTVSENATTLWFSPPRIFALAVLFTGIALFLVWRKRRDLRTGVIVGLLFGSLVGFKVYIGIFALFGLGVVALYDLLKKDIKVLIPLSVAGIVSLLLYLPVNTGAGGLFYTGFWRVENFAVRPQLRLVGMELARLTFLQYKNYLRVWLIDFLYLGFYLFFLFGVFSIGLIQSKKSLKLFPLPLHLFLLSGLGISLIAGLFFLQNTGGANTLQFLFAVYIVGSFYAALACSYWLPKKLGIIAVILSLFIITLTGTRVVYETSANISDLIMKKGYYTISNNELAALRFIETQVPENDIILVEKDRALDDNCYSLSLVAPKNYFLCGNGILEDHGAPTAKRVASLEMLFSSSEIKNVAHEINANNISYVYLPRDKAFKTTAVKEFLTEAFKNDAVTVYKVEKEKALRLAQ